MDRSDLSSRPRSERGGRVRGTTEIVAILLLVATFAIGMALGRTGTAIRVLDRRTIASGGGA